MHKSISILGCGWLGLPLAKHFLMKDFVVAGSTTSKGKLAELTKFGINAYHLTLPYKPEEASTQFFANAAYLVIDIPPQTRNKGVNYHRDCIQSILHAIHPAQQVIYVSATSVYPPIDAVITEETPVDDASDRARALVQVEELLRESLGERLTILRMGGLLGYDRIPGSYSAGKEITGAREKVNYIHRDDAVNIIHHIITKEIWGELLNVVAPKHPLKQAVYEKNAEQYDFESPLFKQDETDKTSRQIEGGKLVRLLDYSFIYPDPSDFYYTN